MYNILALDILILWIETRKGSTHAMLVNIGTSLLYQEYTSPCLYLSTLRF